MDKTSNAVNMALTHGAVYAYFIHPALALALDYVRVRPDELRECTVRYEGGLYEVRITTDYLNYDLYVDCTSGEVPGCMTAPVVA